MSTKKVGKDTINQLDMGQTAMQTNGQEVNGGYQEKEKSVK